MPRPLDEQVIVITGASSGIGRAAALEFGRKRATVVLAARNEEGLELVAEEVRLAGGKALVVPTDVSRWESVENLADIAVANFGRVDTWVNDAGTSVYATVEDTHVEEFERVIQVDLLGVIYGVKAILPYMKARGEGTIINLGSVISQRAFPLQPAYSAAKHGVKGFTEALRLELKRDHSHINVTLIMPASVNTPFFNHARSRMGVRPMPLPPVYTPELAAKTIVHAAEHPETDWYVGGAGMMFSLLERLSPALADAVMRPLNWSFRLQQSNKPGDQDGTVFTPIMEPGRVEGDWGKLTKPSLFTPFFELMPAWQRLLVPALIAGAVVFFRRR